MPVLRTIPRPSSGMVHFDIGRDGDGFWVAIARQGQCGGLFRTIDDALHFASREAGRGDRPAVTFTTERLDLLFASAAEGRSAAQR